MTDKRTACAVPDILLYGQTEEGAEASRERCKECRYRGCGEALCGYIGVTGKARILISPDVGEDCAAFEPAGDGPMPRKVQAMTVMPNAGERTEDQEARSRQRLYRQMKDMYKEGMSDRAIAAELRVGAYTVRRWRQREGLGVNNHGAVPDKVLAERREKTREMWAKGCSDNEIAKALHTSKRSIVKWRKEMGLPAHWVNGKKVERHADE